MRRLPGPLRKPTSRWTSRQARGAGGWPDRRSVAAADTTDKPQSDSSRCGLARRCRSGGQRGPRDQGKRKRFGPLRRSRLSLAARLTGAKVRRRRTTWGIPPARLLRSAVARYRRSDQPLAGSSGSGEGRFASTPKSEFGREAERARARPGPPILSRTLTASPLDTRGSTPPALFRNKPRGARVRKCW